MRKKNANQTFNFSQTEIIQRETGNFGKQTQMNKKICKSVCMSDVPFNWVSSSAIPGIWGLTSGQQ